MLATIINTRILTEVFLARCKILSIRTKFYTGHGRTKLIFVNDGLGDHTYHVCLTLFIDSHQETSIGRQIHGRVVVHTFERQCLGFVTGNKVFV